MYEAHVDDEITGDGPASYAAPTRSDGGRETMFATELDDRAHVICAEWRDYAASTGDELSVERLCPFCKANESETRAWLTCGGF
jgi:hypothetical protein